MVTDYKRESNCKPRFGIFRTQARVKQESECSVTGHLGNTIPEKIVKNIEAHCINSSDFTPFGSNSKILLIPETNQIESKTISKSTEKSSDEKRDDPFVKDIPIDVCIPNEKEKSNETISNLRESVKSTTSHMVVKKVDISAISCNFIKNKTGNFTKLRSTKTPHSIFQCPLCTFKGKCFSKLDDHMVVHTGEKKYSCKYCGRKYRWKYSLVAHEEMHLAQPRFQCKVCKKAFFDKVALNNHMTSQHNPNAASMFKCDKCDMSFKYKKALGVHVIYHTKKEELCLCEYCGELVKSGLPFKHHIYKHRGERPYVCDFCGKTFSTYRPHRRHVKYVHEGHVKEKRLLCTVCGNLYSSITHLEAHSIKHSNDRPYKCDICMKTYRTKANLKSHKNMHLGIKPYSCNVCGRTFLNNPNKIKHERRHSDVRPHKCLACEKSFYEKQELSRHIQKHHEEK